MKRERSTTVVSSRVGPGLLRRIRAAAKRLGLSVNAWIRMTIKRALDGDGS